VVRSTAKPDEKSGKEPDKGQASKGRDLFAPRRRGAEVMRAGPPSGAVLSQVWRTMCMVG